MVPLRPAIAFVFSCSLLGIGCAGPTQERRMYPEPPNSVQQELGYRDIVRIGQEYAVSSGYEVTEVAEAVQVRPNYWRIRFGLAPRGSGRLLDVEFDQAQQQVVGSTEVGGAAGRVTPGP
ncbi:hypothetical protein F0U61_45925 [Archangium violaceum]|uniref:hypothetical protein n=1 Tax=Archangium violaceum TaxID=83451 RepID=UPI002B28DB3C|nr:hypothetical protein F0U61_45925 [Archangium violaceum]